MKKRSIILSAFALLLSASVALAAAEPSQLVRKGNLRVLELQGTPYERGRTHGQTLKQEIQELINRWKANIEKSFSVPAETYIRKLLDASDFQLAVERWTPGLLDEVRGIADGAGVDFQTTYAFQLIDETWVMNDDLDLSKCTTIAARKRGDTPAFVAQNLDIPSFYHGFQTVLRIRGSDEEPEALVFTIPGIVAANGLSDRSVGVCVNAVTQLAYSAKGLPVAFVIRGTLRQKTYADAVRFLKEIQPAAPMKCRSKCSASSRVLPVSDWGRRNEYMLSMTVRVTRELLKPPPPDLLPSGKEELRVICLSFLPSEIESP
jgi:isopenicillin-N N-acyltransferase-like protein